MFLEPDILSKTASAYCDDDTMTIALYCSLIYRSGSSKNYAGKPPFLTTQLPLVDILEGLSLLLWSKIYNSLTFRLHPTFLILPMYFLMHHKNTSKIERITYQTSKTTNLEFQHFLFKLHKQQPLEMSIKLLIGIQTRST